MAMVAHEGPVDTRLQTSMQTSLFGSLPFGCKTIGAEFEPLDARSRVLFEPGWVQGSDGVFEQLRDELPWRSVERPMYDRIVDVPRLICTVAIDSLATRHPLAGITHALEGAFGLRFPSVGVNYYRTGNDSVAWHGDSIGRTGTPATVLLVSLGSPRTLAMRPAPPRTARRRETTRTTPVTSRRWQLGHGDLFVMAGACQSEWEHSVPKERGVGARISLAFRAKEACEGPRKGGAGVPPLLASHKLQ